MKNIFKDKAVLSAKRKLAENLFVTDTKPEIAPARQKADKLIHKLKAYKSDFWGSVISQQPGRCTEGPRFTS